MSIVAFKRKSVINYGSKRSGKSTNKNWIYQGPYGLPTTLASDIYSQGVRPKGELSAGFSLEGPWRNIGRVGQSMRMSKTATPFRGVHPVGYGGTRGRYPHSVSLNIMPILTEVASNQQQYVKPPVLSTRGMLARRYRWIANGQYPVNWVQPNYTGNQTDSASQGLYIQRVSAANDCYVNVNDTDKYKDYYATCTASEQCVGGKTDRLPFHYYTPEMVVTKGYKMWNIRKQPHPPVRRSLSSYAPYTKTLGEPQTASQHTLHIQRQCANPTPAQKPYPYAVSTGTGILQNGLTVNPGNSCGTTNAVTLRQPVESGASSS